MQLFLSISSLLCFTLFQDGRQFMQHSKRRKLSTPDFNISLGHKDCQVCRDRKCILLNDACWFSNCQPVFGHGSPEGVQWLHIKEADITIAEDSDVPLANLACSSQPITKSGEVTCSGKSFQNCQMSCNDWLILFAAQWLGIEGVQKADPASGVQSPGKGV
jgi:hypothetical protein